VFLRIPDSLTLRWGNNDFLVLAVARATAQSAGQAMLYQKTIDADPFLGLSLYIVTYTMPPLAGAQLSSQYAVSSSPPPTTFLDDRVHLFGARRSAGTLEIRVDGTVSGTLSDSSVNNVDISDFGIDVMIGQNGYRPLTDFQQLHGDIAEMIGIGGSLGDRELANLEQRLKTRYAIP
jgi:hypothetical protein